MMVGEDFEIGEVVEAWNTDMSYMIADNDKTRPILIRQTSVDGEQVIEVNVYQIDDIQGVYQRELCIGLKNAHPDFEEYKSLLEVRLN